MANMERERGASMDRGRVAQWSKDKISTLTTIELKQLMANAVRLNEPDVAALCKEVLGERPKLQAAARKLKAAGLKAAPRKKRVAAAPVAE
jgi:hypothetical protein